MAMKPPPYHRRRERFGWDKHGVIITGAVYPNALDVNAGWTGVLGNVTDPSDSGIAPFDPTPETATFIYCGNGAITPIRFGFPVLEKVDPDQTSFNIALGMATVVGGALTDTPGEGRCYLEIFSGSRNLIHSSREIVVPASGIGGGEYEVTADAMFNLPVDLTDTSIQITPTSFMSGKGYGLAVTYVHLRGVKVVV